MTKQIIKNCPAIYNYYNDGNENDTTHYLCKGSICNIPCQDIELCPLKEITVKCQNVIINHQLYSAEKVYFAGEILREIDNEQV